MCVIQMMKFNSVIISGNDSLVTLAVEQDTTYEAPLEDPHPPTMGWQCCQLFFSKES